MYRKRYKKILPFFAVLVLLDFVINPAIETFYEGFADLTLLFGLFPNHISVIGVGWFLGLIFAFYLIFPFYYVLLKDRRRAWGALAIALAMNYIGGVYFGIGRTNIIFCLCYFIAGGLIYLYKERLTEISRKYWWVVLVAVLLCVAAYYLIGSNTVIMLLLSTMMLVFALGQSNWGGVLGNQITKFFSSISMEVYLSHMVVFRLIEKLHINTALGNGWKQYGATVVIVLGGTVVFAAGINKMLDYVGEIIIWIKNIVERKSLTERL